MPENGQWLQWVQDAKGAIYGDGGPASATEWQRQIFIADRLITGMSGAFNESVSIAKREVLQSIHAIAFDPPEPRKRRTRRDIIVRIGIPTVGGGAIIAGLIELIRMLTA